MRCNIIPAAFPRNVVFLSSDHREWFIILFRATANTISFTLSTHLAAVRTGRLSCRKPNLQQIPGKEVVITDVEGKQTAVSFRDIFCCSSEKKVLFSCDYSQNEIRILAHLSGDETLISMFNNTSSGSSESSGSSGSAIDIYKEMSAKLSGKKVSEITDDERSLAKQTTLAIIYGMGIPTIATRLNITMKYAADYSKSFFSRFNKIKPFINSSIEHARKHGYVTTITGRRRYLEDIRSTDKSAKARAERQAVNSIIQGRWGEKVLSEL